MFAFEVQVCFWKLLPLTQGSRVELLAATRRCFRRCLAGPFSKGDVAGIHQESDKCRRNQMETTERGFFLW